MERMRVEASEPLLPHYRRRNARFSRTCVNFADENERDWILCDFVTADYDYFEAHRAARANVSIFVPSLRNDRF